MTSTLIINTSEAPLLSRKEMTLLRQEIPLSPSSILAIKTPINLALHLKTPIDFESLAVIQLSDNQFFQTQLPLVVDDEESPFFNMKLGVLSLCKTYRSSIRNALTELVNRHAALGFSLPSRFDLTRFYFGTLIQTEYISEQMGLQAAQKEKDYPNKAILDCNLHFVYDANLSYHDKIQAIPILQSYLTHYHKYYSEQAKIDDEEYHEMHQLYRLSC